MFTVIAATGDAKGCEVTNLARGRTREQWALGWLASGLRTATGCPGTGDVSWARTPAHPSPRRRTERAVDRRAWSPYEALRPLLRVTEAPVAASPQRQQVNGSLFRIVHQALQLI